MGTTSCQSTFGTGGALTTGMLAAVELYSLREQSNLQQVKENIETNTALGVANQRSCIAAGKAQAQGTKFQAINEGIGAIITAGGIGLQSFATRNSAAEIKELKVRQEDLSGFQKKLQTAPENRIIPNLGDGNQPDLQPEPNNIDEPGIKDLVAHGCPRNSLDAKKTLTDEEKASYTTKIQNMSPEKRQQCAKITQDEILALNTDISSKEKSYSEQHSVIFQAWVPMLNNVSAAVWHSKQATQQNIQGQMQGLGAIAQSGAGTVSSGMNSAMQANSADAEAIRAVLQMLINCQPR